MHNAAQPFMVNIYAAVPRASPSAYPPPQGLTRLCINTLEVDPPALHPLTALTNLAHISWGLVFPQAQFHAEKTREIARLEAYLAQWSTWTLPVVQLSVQGPVLTPKALTLLGKLRWLTALELQGCSSRIDCPWPEQEPYRVMRYVCKGYTVWFHWGWGWVGMLVSRWIAAGTWLCSCQPACQILQG